MEIKDIRRIAFKPGDKLVVRVRHPVSHETAERIRDGVERFAPGVPVLVIDTDMSLEVLSEVA